MMNHFDFITLKLMFIQQARLQWLGHILRMDEKRSMQKMMFATRGSSWKKSRGGHQLTCQ